MLSILFIFFPVDYYVYSIYFSVLSILPIYLFYIFLVLSILPIYFPVDYRVHYVHYFLQSAAFSVPPSGRIQGSRVVVEDLPPME